MEMAGGRRLRVVFEDASLLRKSQRRQGLQRCWFQLWPDIATISDLASQLHQTFGLHRCRPRGLIISMGGFVLPPFESTCILKDEDIIMINRKGVIFKDVVEFCDSQNQDQVLQSREILFCKNRSLTRMDPPVNSSGDGHDMVRCNGGAVHIGTIPSERMNGQCKRKHFNNIQGSDNSFTSKVSHEYEEDIFLHGNMTHKETTSNEMVKKKHKKKHTDKLQTSITLESRGFESDSHKRHGIPPIPHEETSSEMIKAKLKKKHSYKLLGSKESHGNPQRDEQDVIHHVNTACKEAISHETMNSKHKRKRSNELQASDSALTSKKSEVASQGDTEDLDIPNGSKSDQEIPSCELTNAKRRRKHSNRHQGSDDILAIKDSYGDSKRYEEDAGTHGNMVHNETTTNEMLNAKCKKSRSNKHHISEIKSMGTDAMTELKAGANGDAKKGQSRSSIRKKAKRKWHRTHASENKLIEIQIPESHNRGQPLGQPKADQKTNLDKDISPVIIHRGHIRFESSDDSSVREDELVETLQWDGITSKKKGQKWGREKSYNKWNDDTSNKLCNEESDDRNAEVVEVSNEESAVEEAEAFKESVAEQVEPVSECEYSVGKELKAVEKLIDYESFLHLNRLPEEGDILVYRVVELSSSWCPELSPFRIGKVSSYDSSSSNIILLPLPEYPLISDEMLEEWQEINSLYKEDGTLEIDFPFLLDVRLFKSAESEDTPITPVEEMHNAAPANNQGSEGCSDHTVNVQQLDEGWEAINRVIEEKKAQLQKKNNSGERNSSESTAKGWEAINCAIDDKKVELQKKNNFDRRKSSERTATGPWSYKALRRNALGPTLAILRSSDGELL